MYVMNVHDGPASCGCWLLCVLAASASGLPDRVHHVHHVQAYKYTPFGPLATVMPYLIRRAQENSTLLGGAQTELQLVQVGRAC